MVIARILLVVVELSILMLILAGNASCWQMDIEQQLLDDVPSLDLKLGNYSAFSFTPSERQFEFNIGFSAIKLEIGFGPLDEDLQENHPFFVYVRPHGYTPATISEDDSMIVFPKWNGTISQQVGDKEVMRYTFYVELNGSAPIINETDGDWVLGMRITDSSISTLDLRIGGVKSNEEPSANFPEAQGDLFPGIYVIPLYIIIFFVELVIGIVVYFAYTRHKKNHAALGELQDKMIKQGIMAAIGAIIMVVALVFPVISIALSFRYPTFTCCQYLIRPGISNLSPALDDSRCFEGEQGSDFCFFGQFGAQTVIQFVWYIWPWGAIVGLLSWLVGMSLVVISGLQFSRLLKSQHQGTPAVTFTVSHEF